MGELTGKAYQPSNGTEDFYVFGNSFCHRCAHEKFLHTANDLDLKCHILSSALVFDVKQPDYPKEWVYGEDDMPTCTAFKKFDWVKNEETGEWNEEELPDPPDPNQLALEL